MRKILLGTTAVVGAALLGNVAQAQTAPTVRVGGYFEFAGGYVDDTADRNAVTVAAGTAGAARTVNRDKIDFKTDAEIVVIVAGKAANGLSYGAQVELQIDNFIPQAATTAGTGVDTDEAWGFISSPTLGTLQFGDQDSAASQMAVSLPGAVAQLGMSGQWDEFVALAADGNRYLVNDINDGSDATKIIYMSPQFFGFDFGVSFAPNGREGEEYRTVSSGLTAATQTLQRNPNDSIRNELSGAIRYRGSFGNIGVTAGLAAHRADAQANNAALQDVTEYQAGLNVTGFGLTVGGMYRWGKYGGTTRTPLAAGRDGSTTWGLGATYVTGAIAVGAFYAKAERDNGGTAADRTQTVWGLGTSYTLAPGMDLFANYSNIVDKNIAGGVAGSNGPGGANRNIDVFVIGTRLTF
ncbi:porin [Falsiroseomonas stagni]|uniref:Outer membrane protein (Porin) n=1 Tax=Falsiroseomonas stagni DSM 19981 TaxID=1123062 RepID=A0A1I4A0X2_9PROT|nr:porin [Falsiroseomonas stagni]SFK49870.1 Outer membrane protein (porin) [Falsiroseomonas stagni DSM 19981]